MLFIKWHEIEHFKEEDFACLCGCGRNNFNIYFVKQLDELCKIVGFTPKILLASACEKEALKNPYISSELQKGYLIRFHWVGAVHRYKILKACFQIGFKHIVVKNDYIEIDVNNENDFGFFIL